jgi:hypothetical protein
MRRRKRIISMKINFLITTPVIAIFLLSSCTHESVQHHNKNEKETQSSIDSSDKSSEYISDFKIYMDHSELVKRSLLGELVAEAIEGFLKEHETFSLDDLKNIEVQNCTEPPLPTRPPHILNDKIKDNDLKDKEIIRLKDVAEIKVFFRRKQQ